MFGGMLGVNRRRFSSPPILKVREGEKEMLG